MILNREPAAVISALGEIAKAIIPVLIFAEAVHWSDKLVAAVMFLVGVGVTSLSIIFTRSQTVSTATANKQIEIAKASPVTRSTDDIIKEAAK